MLVNVTSLHAKTKYKFQKVFCRQLKGSQQILICEPIQKIPAKSTTLHWILKIFLSFNTGMLLWNLMPYKVMIGDPSIYFNRSCLCIYLIFGWFFVIKINICDSDFCFSFLTDIRQITLLHQYSTHPNYPSIGLCMKLGTAFYFEMPSPCRTKLNKQLDTTRSQFHNWIQDRIIVCM